MNLSMLTFYHEDVNMTCAALRVSCTGKLMLCWQKKSGDREAEHGHEPPAAGESAVREGPPLTRDTALQRFHVSMYRLT